MRIQRVEGGSPPPRAMPDRRQHQTDDEPGPGNPASPPAVHARPVLPAISGHGEPWSPMDRRVRRCGRSYPIAAGCDDSRMTSASRCLPGRRTAVLGGRPGARAHTANGCDLRWRTLPPEGTRDATMKARPPIPRRSSRERGTRRRRRDQRLPAAASTSRCRGRRSPGGRRHARRRRR